MALGGENMDDNLIHEYEKILNSDVSNENDIQEYLEEHSQIIPLPILENHNLNMNVVISKLKLGNEFITDFAYLTKSSINWKLVLMELENPHKQIFKQGSRIEFTAAFNNAIDQISSWKVYLRENEIQILRQTAKLRQPLETNPMNYGFVLIYGRRKEFEDSEKRRKFLAQKEIETGIKIMTYDSLITHYTNNVGIDCEKIILSQHGEQGFKIKKLPIGPIYTSIFSYLPQDYIEVDKLQEKRLKAEGYEMDEWRQGYSLYSNEKKATDSLLKKKIKFGCDKFS